MNTRRKMLTAGTLVLAGGSIIAGALLTSSAIAAPDSAPKATITQINISSDGTTSAFKCEITVPELPVPSPGGAWLAPEGPIGTGVAGVPAGEPTIVINSGGPIGEGGVPLPAPADAPTIIVGAGADPSGLPTLNAINVTGNIDDIRDGTAAECAAVPTPDAAPPLPAGTGGAAG